MPLDFKIGADTSGFEQKINEIPKKAEKAGEDAQKSFSAGMKRGAADSTSSYVAQMKASAAKAMGAVAPEERQAAKKRGKTLGQIAAEEDAKARAQWDRDDRAMDDAKARTRAQRRAKIENEEREKESDKRERMTSIGRTLRGVAGFMGGIQQAQEAYIQSRNSVLERSTLSQQQRDLVEGNTRKARGASTMAETADIAESYQKAISEQEFQKIAEPENGSILEQSLSGYQLLGRKMGLFKGQTQAEKRQAGDQQRIDMLQKQMQDAIETGKRNVDERNSYNSVGPGERVGYATSELDKKVAEQRKITDFTDPTNIIKFQRLQADIKRLTPTLLESAQAYTAQRDALTGLLPPQKQLVKLDETRASIMQRLDPTKSNATPEEREFLRGRLDRLNFQRDQLEVESSIRSASVGLMGAGGRREAYRQMRREQRELDRGWRIERNGGQDSRAFSRDIIDPKRGFDALRNGASEKHLQSIDATLKDIERKTGSPALR